MKKDTRLIFIFAIIKFLSPFIFISSAFELHRDEYLYLADADHLAHAEFLFAGPVEDGDAQGAGLRDQGDLSRRRQGWRDSQQGRPRDGEHGPG